MRHFFDDGVDNIFCGENIIRMKKANDIACACSDALVQSVIDTFVGTVNQSSDRGVIRLYDG
jgi:hypothetical protein